MGFSKVGPDGLPNLPVSADPRRLTLRTKWVPVMSYICTPSGDRQWANIGAGTVGTRGNVNISWDVSRFVALQNLTTFRLRWFNNCGVAFPGFFSDGRPIPRVKVNVQDENFANSVPVTFLTDGFAQQYSSPFTGDYPLVSLPISKTINANTPFNLQIVFMEVPGNGATNMPDWAPNIAGAFSNLYDRFNTAKALMYVGQDTIGSGRGTATHTGDASRVDMVVPDILVEEQGSTRKPRCAVIGDSWLDSVKENVHEWLVNFGYAGGTLAHAGAAPDGMWSSGLVRGLAENNDIIINGLGVNLISYTAIRASAYFGGATLTDTSKMIEDTRRCVQSSGQAWIQVLPYPAGLDLTNPLAQTKNGWVGNQVTYDRIIDYRNRMIAANPDDVGLVYDLYAPVLDFTPGDATHPIKFKADDIGGGLRGVNAGAAFPSLFRFTCSAYASNRFTINPTAVDGLWPVLPAGGNFPLTSAQREVFGDGRVRPGGGDFDGSRSSGSGWAGAKLVCISGDPSVVGQVLTINNKFPLWNPAVQGHVFSCNEAASGTYAGSVWEMRIPVDGDNKGSVSAISTLHLTLPMRSYCWALFCINYLKPLLQSIKGV